MVLNETDLEDDEPRDEGLEKDELDLDNDRESNSRQLFRRESVETNNDNEDYVPPKIKPRRGKRQASVFVSSWVALMDSEVLHFTAGKNKSIAGFFGAIGLVLLLTFGYLFMLCRIESSIFGGPVGYGDQVLSRLSANDADISTAKAIASMFSIILWGLIYILDVRKWHKWTGRVVVLIASVSLGLTLLFLSNQILFAPYLVFTLLSIAVTSLFKTLFFRDVDKLLYVRGLAISCVICAFLMLFLFFYSVVIDEEKYEGRVKIKYLQLLDCEESVEFPFDELLENETLLEEFENSTLDLQCEEAVLVWISPLIFFFSAISLAGVLWVLYRAERRRRILRRRVGLEPIERSFVIFLGVAVVSLWISVSLANATTTVDTTVFSIMIVVLISMVVSALAVFQRKYFWSQFTKSPLGSKIYGFATSDWGKAALVFLGSPFVVIFLMSDYIKQLIRRKTYVKRLFQPEELKTNFTKSVQNFVDGAKKWDYGSIILKGHLFALILFFLLVGVSKFVILIFSYLREQILLLSFFQGTLICMFIGLAMHILPRTPIVPSYIFSGLVLPSLGEQEGVMTFTSGVIFAGFLCWIVRLVSRLVQFKLFGQFLAPMRTRLRRLAKVNDPGMRAAHLLLLEKGNNKRKAILLAGGPDWTTGVFTGLKHHDLGYILLLSAPVFLRIVPCVFMGAMVVKSGENPDSDLFTLLNTVGIIGTIAFLIVPVIQSAQIRNQAKIYYKEEIEAEEFDLQVKAVEDRMKLVKAKFTEITAWDQLSKPWKFFHVLSMISLTITFYMFQLLQNTLFVVFDVTDTISDDLGGRALHIVREPGWVVLSMFILSYVYLITFNKVFKKRARVLLRDDEGTPVHMTL